MFVMSKHDKPKYGSKVIGIDLPVPIVVPLGTLMFIPVYVIEVQQSVPSTL